MSNLDYTTYNTPSHPVSETVALRNEKLFNEKLNFLLYIVCKDYEYCKFEYSHKSIS